jgi:uncharacterized protein YqjF (DUF2071 family)
VATPVFLSAVWRDLVMLNYQVDPALLREFVPTGTELDTFDGRTYVSLVGFRFLGTRVRGIRIPFHQNFEEVNLRFYVRRAHPEGARRGVVFIREIVPKWAVAMVARRVFHENYISLPMVHRVGTGDEGLRLAEYLWLQNGDWQRLFLECSGVPERPPAGSLAEFITEHYWGYAKQPDGSTLEYQVTHDPWRVWTASRAYFEGETASLYGAALAEVVKRNPDSAFLAEGSVVQVFTGVKL